MSFFQFRSTFSRNLTMTLSAFVFVILIVTIFSHKKLSGPDAVKLELPSPDWDAVTFRTADGVRLAGWYAPSLNGAAVVMLHGFGNDRRQVLPEGGILRRQGYGVLLYDTRGHGESEGVRNGYTDAEKLDLKAALDFLATRSEVDKRRIGAYGFSMGSYILARQGADDARLAAFVLAGAPTSLKEIMPRLMPRPVLIIAGGLDQTVPPQDSELLFQAAKDPKAIQTFGKARHGEYYTSEPERFEKMLTNFFDFTLAKKPN
ncbi:MAG: alpha/beta fold hydrolase [Chitinophagaceae bacterium]|nr:alpha/beta fold hydrolase [Oligoflexus sp.]